MGLKHDRTHSHRAFALGLALLLLGAIDSAFALDLGYGGRLVDASGAPVGGPVDLSVRYYLSATDGTAVLTKSHPGVSLVDGVFQLNLDLSAGERETLFGTNASVHIEIHDLSHDQTYPRQLIHAVPLAARVPVDGSTISFNEQGQLTAASPKAAANTAGLIQATSAYLDVDGNGAITAIKQAQSFTGALSGDVTGTQNATVVERIRGKSVSGTLGAGNDGQVLKWDYASNSFILANDLASGGLNTGDVTSSTIADGTIANIDISNTAAIDASKIAGGGVSDAEFNYLASVSSDLQAQLDGKQAAITSSTELTVATLTSENQAGFTLNAYGSSAGQTGELRLVERDGLESNYVGFKAPDSITANRIWTLPAADGTSGQVLSTNGSGVLSWSTASTSSATETLTGKSIDADSNTISNIEDADIKSNAAIARTKLAAGTAAHVVINDGSGVISSEAQLAISRGGTGAATASAALNNLLPSQSSNSGKVLSTDGSNASWTAINSSNWDSAYSDRLKWDGGSTGLVAATGRTSLGLGTVATLDAGTSANNLIQLDGTAKLPAVDGSALTNLSASNLTGTVSIAKGGTGASTAAGALNSLLPSQTSNSGKMLTTDGTNASWSALNTSNWDTAYTDRLKWDGGSTDLNAATARTSLGLGAAATLSVGTSAYSLVQLDGTAKLPAVDGSQLTGVVTSTTVASATAVMDADFSSNGLMARTGAGTYSVVTDSSSNWNTAYTDRLKWDGGSNGLVAATARTSLGLGTSATLDIGTTANKVVQLDASARLPAVDASQLTNLPAASLTCPTGYILVPGHSTFTNSNFCVMKYHAKKDATTGQAVSTAAGAPWVSISWYEAISACNRVGAHLMTEGEWMTIARNIEATAINDVDAAAGIQFANGHSDSSPASGIATTTGAEPSLASCTLTLPLSDASNSGCELRGPGTYAGNDTDKGYYGTGQGYGTAYSAGGSNKSQLRTKVLSNGNVIWDFGGNAWNWTDARCDTTNWYGADVDWNNANVSDWEKMVAGPSGSLAIADGTGGYFGCVASGNAMLRGGAYAHGSWSGLYASDVKEAPTLVHTHIGFRCTYGNVH